MKTCNTRKLGVQTKHEIKNAMQKKQVGGKAKQVAPILKIGRIEVINTNGFKHERNWTIKQCNGSLDNRGLVFAFIGGFNFVEWNI